MKYYNYPQPRGTEVAVDLDSKNVNDYVGGGSGGGVFIVNAARELRSGTYVFVCDKAFKEIKNALLSGNIVIIEYHGGDYGDTTDICEVVVCIETVFEDPENTVYRVYTALRGVYDCVDENDYPINWGSH